MEVEEVKRISCSGAPIAALLILLLTAGGCGSKQARFYMLSSSVDAGAASSVRGGTVLGVGPVTLPDYLIRYEIVTRKGPSEMVFAEFNRWAEPLDETMVRVLAENLAALLPDADVRAYPYVQSEDIDYRIRVEVRSFELHPDGNVHLVALWRLMTGPDDTSPPERADLTANAGKGDYEEVVAAMSSALVSLSEEIAGSLPK
jgi:uncharacterized lipoprotein YmbA